MKVLPNFKERLDYIGKVIGATDETTHNRVVAWNHPTGIIHSYVGGSDLHGASVGSDDLDIYGIFIEKPEFTLGISGFYGDPKWATLQWSTAPDTRKNTRDDVDICVHSLRKWAYLAAGGNPTILQFLYAPVDNQNFAWDMVRSQHSLFLAKRHVNAFLGYAKEQYERMNGRKASTAHRPELVEKYGYDTKMAMHMIRLMYEGDELLRDGKLTFPRPEKELLINIRSGKYKRYEVNLMYEQMVDSLEQAAKSSDLPDRCDTAKINKLLSEIYHAHWMVYDWYPHPVRWA